MMLSAKVAATQAELGGQHFPHEADAGVRGFDPTPEAAFGRAAGALTAVVTDNAIAGTFAVELECDAPEKSNLCPSNGSDARPVSSPVVEFVAMSFRNEKTVFEEL